MKRKLIVLSMGLLAITVLGGCGRENNDSAPADADKSYTEEANDTTDNSEGSDDADENTDVSNLSSAWSDPCMDAVQITDEVFESYATEDWQIAYKDILDSTYDGLKYTKSGVTDAMYYLYDIDKDDIPELMIKQGADDNSYMTDIYYWDGSEAKHAGEAYSGRTVYYSDPYNNGVIGYSMHMGWGYAYRLSIENGELIDTDNTVFEDDMMSRYELDLEPEAVPVTDYVEGAKILRWYNPMCIYPLLNYNGSVYAAGRESLSDEEFKTLIDGVINSNEEFYWVTTENYSLQDCKFKPNKVDLEYLTSGDELITNGSKGVKIKNTWFEDFNGDGFTECLVELRGVEYDSLAVILFSYQHGNIYGYTSHYMGDWSIDVRDGSIYASGIYDGGMQITYEYCLDQAKMCIDYIDCVIFSDAAMKDLDDFRNTLKTDGSKLGVAYIGASGNYSFVYMDELLSDARSEFGDMKFMGELGKCHVVKQPGEDVFVLVPAEETYVIRVYEEDWGDYDPDIYPKRGELLYEGAPGEVVIVRCNQSDIVSNVEISVDMNGTELIYSPMMSLEDGSLMTDVGIYDFGKDNLIAGN